MAYNSEALSHFDKKYWVEIMWWISTTDQFLCLILVVNFRQSYSCIQFSIHYDGFSLKILVRLTTANVVNSKTSSKFIEKLPAMRCWSSPSTGHEGATETKPNVRRRGKNHVHTLDNLLLQDSSFIFLA